MPKNNAPAPQQPASGSRHVGKAITGAAAGAVMGGLGGLPGAIFGGVVGAAANVLAGVQHERDLAASNLKRKA